MSKFTHLDEEDDIKIDIIDDTKRNFKDQIQIILRNAQSENMKYTIDKTKTKNVLDMKNDV
jgi:hypothetical protein